jgi:hypothetical protein
MTTGNGSIRSVAVISESNVARIGCRLWMSFPEVVKCFPFLSWAAADGGSWQRALGCYVNRLSDRSLSDLCLEVADLFSMGWSEHQFELVMVSIFGLDVSLGAENGSASGFVAIIREHLRGHRVERDVADSR